jgi:hypothetical protein
MNDDNPLFVVRRDISGGINTRQGDNVIGETQSTVLKNVELNTAGERSVRSGLTQIDATFPVTACAGAGLFGFEPDGGTNLLLIMQATAASGAMFKYTGTGTVDVIPNASAWTRIAGNDPKRTTMVKALESDEADVVIIQNGYDPAFRYEQGGTFENLEPVPADVTLSPPRTRAMTWYRDRLWTLSDNKLHFSEAISSAYASAFVRDTNYYNVPVGTERALVGTRDYGLVIFGSQQIYQLNPTMVPAPATDKPELVLDIGCVNGDTVKQVGDDFLYLAYDGVRSVKRTVQDKLQAGQSQPLSWNLKEEFEFINWAYIANADAVYFNDRYLLTLPTGTSSTNNQVWVYYPALNAWTVISGWNIAKFSTVKFDNELQLYGIDAVSGKLYRLFYGTNDNGTAVEYIEEGGAEDFGKPLQNKWGGEYKLRLKGNNVSITPTADIGQGFVALAGNTLTLPAGGFDINPTFDFPISFDYQEANGVWHMDNLGKFKTIKFRVYCNTKDAEFIIKETLATTFGEEYMSED